jgi:hypothetical protein
MKTRIENPRVGGSIPSPDTTCRLKKQPFRDLFGASRLSTDSTESDLAGTAGAHALHPTRDRIDALLFGKGDA